MVKSIWITSLALQAEQGCEYFRLVFGSHMHVPSNICSLGTLLKSSPPISCVIVHHYSRTAKFWSDLFCDGLVLSGLQAVWKCILVCCTHVLKFRIFKLGMINLGVHRNGLLEQFLKWVLPWWLELELISWLVLYCHVCLVQWNSLFYIQYTRIQRVAM